MKKVFFVLQGKGGVGKTFAASVLAQYLRKQTDSVICFDTDPVNQSFYRVRALNARVVNILTDHQTIDSSKFDGLIESILDGDENITVIDCGASTFIPLMAYIAENEIMSLFSEAGVSVYANILITGGASLPDSVKGANYVTDIFPNCIIWMNNHLGDTSGHEKVLKPILNKPSIEASLNLPRYNPDTFGVAMLAMTENHLTFDEMETGDLLTFMPKRRVAKVKNDIFSMLDTIEAFQVLNEQSLQDKTEE